MSNCRYYIVGNNDKWMIQFKDTENGQYRAVTTRPHSRSLLRKSLACGERAPTYACSMMMAACDANGATIEIVTHAVEINVFWIGRVF
jgi:hypothetical protein